MRNSFSSSEDAVSSLANMMSVTSGLLDRAKAAAETAAARNDAAAKDDAATNAKVASEFEGMLVSILLKQMRQTIGGDGLFAGEKSDTYGGLFDLYMGDHIAQSGGMGIASIIEAYLAPSETETDEQPNSD